MQVKLIRQYEVDPQVRNYDYSKLAVFSDNGNFLTNIYKHDYVYYNLFENDAYSDINDCLKSLEKRFFKKNRKKA